MKKKNSKLLESAANFDELISSEAMNTEKERNNLSHRNALLKMVQEVLENELTEKQRCAIEYVYYDNISVTNTAKIMGISQSACSRLLKRGKDKIRNILSYGYFPVWSLND